MVPFDAVIQDGHHHVFTRVAPLPRPHDVHVRMAVMDVVVAVLRKETRTARSERREGDDDDDEDGMPVCFGFCLYGNSGSLTRSQDQEMWHGTSVISTN